MMSVEVYRFVSVFVFNILFINHDHGCSQYCIHKFFLLLLIGKPLNYQVSLEDKEFCLDFITILFSFLKLEQFFVRFINRVMAYSMPNDNIFPLYVYEKLQHQL